MNPFRYIKPLTLEQKLVVECVTTRYEGVEAPFMVIETEDTVTLLHPPTIRPTFLRNEQIPKEAPSILRLPAERV